MAKTVVIYIMDRDESKTKCSFGINYPVCNIPNTELQNLQFIGDVDEALYEAEVSDKIYKRLTR